MLYLDPADDRVACIAFQGKQTIEAYHSCLQRFRLLGRKNGPGKRAIRGNFKHDFYYTLADLIWNLTIAFHLKNGIEREPIDWDDLNKNRLRDDKKVERHKAMSSTTDPTSPGHDPPHPIGGDLVPPADLPIAA
jgi:hypothetical protein